MTPILHAIESPHSPRGGIRNFIHTCSFREKKGEVIKGWGSIYNFSCIRNLDYESGLRLNKIINSIGTGSYQCKAFLEHNFMLSIFIYLCYYNSYDLVLSFRKVLDKKLNTLLDVMGIPQMSHHTSDIQTSQGSCPGRTNEIAEGENK